MLFWFFFFTTPNDTQGLTLHLWIMPGRARGSIREFALGIKFDLGSKVGLAKCNQAPYLLYDPSGFLNNIILKQIIFQYDCWHEHLNILPCALPFFSAHFFALHFTDVSRFIQFLFYFVNVTVVLLLIARMSMTTLLGKADAIFSPLKASCKHAIP